jgi:hypothetical protein
MKIIKIAGKKILVKLIVDPKTGQKIVQVLDGQNIGKKCDKIINALNPGEGNIEHNKDYYRSQNSQEPDNQENQQYEVL